MEKIARRCLRLRLGISILWKTISIFPLREYRRESSEGNIFLIENVPKTKTTFNVSQSTFQRERPLDTHHLFFSITNDEKQMEN
jgi:hypothetical protein